MTSDSTYSSTPFSSSSSSSQSSPAATSLSSSFLSSWPSSPSPWRHVLMAVLIALLCTSTLTEACFIRNCPKGGKRSMDTVAVGQRQCMSCGPDNSGQCVGPQICCSQQFGCHFGSPEAEVCQKENESTTPCYISGAVCGSRDSGKCVAPGICCDSESCAINGRCQTRGQDSVQDKSRILKLIQRLLQTKAYD